MQEKTTTQEQTAAPDQTAQPLRFEDEFRVLQFECDPWDRMTPGAMLRRVQDIGMLQTMSLGWDEAFYRKYHFLFLLSKISIEVNKMPLFGQQVRIEARGYGLYRSVYHRVTALYSRGGEKLCEADSRWVLLDTEARKIIRRLPEEMADIVSELPPGEAHGLKMPKPETPLFTFDETHASYTMCDRNGHLNNTHYADLICDHLPLERLRQGPPHKMLLFFHNEIKLGHSFTLDGGAVGPNGYYFVAGENEKRNFEGYAEF